MCTSFIRNGKKTIVGFNLDLSGMTHRIHANSDHVFIQIQDEAFGWLPLFGVNQRGDFVAMPTCYPYDARSEQTQPEQCSILMADIDLLLMKKSFEEVRALAEGGMIYSLPNITWQMQITDKSGNVLRHTPGQGSEYLAKPAYSLMTNFSPWKEKRDEHPWSGADRYALAEKLLTVSGEEFDTADGFAVLKATAQLACPTVVSLIYDATEHTAYWCENRAWEAISKQRLNESRN